jgi:hypothetical protein
MRNGEDINAVLGLIFLVAMIVCYFVYDAPVFAIFVIPLFVSVGIAASYDEARTKEVFQDYLERGSNFIGLDHNNVLMIGTRKNYVELKRAELVRAEIKIRRANVTTRNRGSQVAGAAIGGVVLGGVGAVIGGLSGSQITREVIERITLEIETRNGLRRFLLLSGSCDPDSKAVTRASQQVA